MEIENGRVVSVIGDKDDPAYHGFTCKKGRDLPNHLYHPSRLLQPLRRAEGGEFKPAASAEVIPEIAARLRAIIDEHGPESVALYSGTYALGPVVVTTVSGETKAHEVAPLRVYRRAPKGTGHLLRPPVV